MNSPLSLLYRQIHYESLPTMKTHLLTVFLIALLALPSQAAPLLSVSTETKLTAAQTPSAAMMQAILSQADKEDVKTLNECRIELGLKKNAYPRLFKAVSLPAPKPGTQLYFVRPALQPYCQTFYGAHLFRFWLVSQTQQQFTVDYAGVGDAFEVLPSQTNGHYDISETNCTASRCSTVEMKYGKNGYKPNRCSETHFRKDGTELKTVVKCWR